MSPSCCELRQFVDRRCHALGHQNLAVLGLVAEPGRNVGYSADCGIVEAALETDLTERGIALSDPDAKADLVPTSRP